MPSSFLQSTLGARSWQRSTEKKTVAERAADLSEEVLESVESGQRAAIDAVRKFVGTVDEAIPARGDRSVGTPDRRRRRPGDGGQARQDAARVRARAPSSAARARR